MLLSSERTRCCPISSLYTKSLAVPLYLLPLMGMFRNAEITIVIFLARFIYSVTSGSFYFKTEQINLKIITSVALLSFFLLMTFFRQRSSFHLQHSDEHSCTTLYSYLFEMSYVIIVINGAFTHQIRRELIIIVMKIIITIITFICIAPFIQVLQLKVVNNEEIKGTECFT